MLCMTTIAAASSVATPTSWPVIRPGQEAELAAMLGRGLTLPGGCRFVGGEVQRSIVVVQYGCATDSVTLELRYPTATATAIGETERFAIFMRSGDLPDGFIHALVSLVRARESTVEWTFVEPETDSYWLWRPTVHANVLVFVVAALATVLCAGCIGRLGLAGGAKGELAIVLLLTITAGLLRFSLASPNLMDFGGTPYSRWLRGYKGYLGAAEFFAVVGTASVRDIPHVIELNRIAGTLTIPLVYLLCRSLQPMRTLWPAIAALLFAVSPLHIAFSASDALAVFSNFLAAASYVLIAGTVHLGRHRLLVGLAYVAGFTGLSLLTQVRYENVMFLVPAAVLLVSRRATTYTRDVAPGLILATAFLGIYAYETALLGVSHTTSVQPDSVRIVWRHLVTNPFLAMPVLLIGTAAVVVCAPRRFGVAALLPWVGSITLASLVLTYGHDGARAYANWLIFVLPVAAYGFCLMLEAPRLFVKIIAATALLFLAAQPILVRKRLASEHLEMLEHDRFAAVLAHLPSSVKTIIVPDDELFRRRSHTTHEVLTKYAMIADAETWMGPQPRLFGVTEYLEHPERAHCLPGTCAFFFGLPCFEQDVYPYTAEQCRQVLGQQRTSVVEETTVRGAPFARCSIYVGTLEQEECVPATREEHFTLYRLDGDAAVRRSTEAARAPG